jgi:hypothetical protein
MIFTIKPLREINAYATKWQVLKYRVKKFIIRSFEVLLIAGLLYVTFQILRAQYPIYKVQEKEVVLDNLTAKVDQLKGEIVNDIKNCESRGFTEDDGIIIFDSNNKASIGLYQFQKATVQHYYKKLYGKDIGGKEAVLIALDARLAGDLTRDILFTTENGADNWLNCSRKLDIENRLNLIKKLQ